MQRFDLTCPWCGAQQLVPAVCAPFRFYCGNCGDLLTYRSEEHYRREFEQIQQLKQREPRWRELDVPKRS